MWLWALSLLCLGALAPLPAAAQTPTPAPRPPGPYVLDVRVATSALPRDASFFPPLPSVTAVPAYGLGFEVGAHIYLIQLGPARLGIGASVLRTRGRSSPGRPAGSATSTSPNVDSTLTNVAPQLSLNFGSREGWSYISAGVGQGDVQTATSAFTASGSGSAALRTPARSSDNPPVQSLNFGGGARWFTHAHLAFSFDVRFHVLAAGAGGGASLRTTLVAGSAGISLR